MNYRLEENNSLYLMIGNSRLHWAWFRGEKLKKVWDGQHLTEPLSQEKIPTTILPPELTNCPSDDLPLYIASVVPSQTIFWQNYPHSQLINLAQIPLQGIYHTLGIDRALAVLGAGEKYGFPCLIIDAGTALTLTGADENCQLIGGAILPGLRLQFQSLATKTAALPAVELPEKLPPRWALNTPEAIASGIIYTTIAGIFAYLINWLKFFPNSQIIITGGDADLLQKYLQIEYPEITAKLICDHQLIFWGMKVVVSQFIDDRIKANCNYPVLFQPTVNLDSLKRQL